MRKEHKKLYKSGKNWMVATMVTAGLAGGVLLGSANNVQADASPATAQTVSADTSVAQASQAVSNDQSRLSSANNTLQQQKSQLSAANDSSNKAAKAYSGAQNAQTKAVSGAQQAYDQAKQNTANAQQEVNQAQQGVQTAQNNEKQAVESAANQKAAAAQSTIDQLKSKATAAQTAQLNNQLSDVNGKISTAQSEVNNTNSQISNLQKQVKDLQNEQENNKDSNIVKVPNGYLDKSQSLLENIARNNLWADNDVMKNNGNIVPQNMWLDPYTNGQEQKDISNNYPADSSAYDPYFSLDMVNQQTGMTNAQKQEMAILLLNVVNHVRAGQGMGPVVMSEKKFNQAQVRAASSAKNWSHDDADIIAAFGCIQDENLGSFSSVHGESMLGLYYRALETIWSFLNGDGANGGHKQNLLNNLGSGADAAFGFQYDPSQQIYYFTFDSYGGPDGTTPNLMDKIKQYAAEGPVKPTSSLIDNSAKINQLNYQISSLQKTLNSQKANLQVLQNQLADLNQQKADVQGNVNNLSSAEQLSYRQAQQTLNTVNAWKQSQLANVDNTASVKAAKQSLAQANNKLKDAQAKEATAKTALDNAKKGNSDLSTKQAAYQAAQQQVKNLNDQIDKTQAAIDQLNAKLKQDQQRLLELQKTKETSTIPVNPENNKKTGQTMPVKPNENRNDKFNAENGTSTASNNIKNGGTVPTTDNNKKTSKNVRSSSSKSVESSVIDKKSVNAHPVAATTSAKAGAAANNNKLTFKLPSNTTAVSANDYAAVNMTREQYKAQQTNTSSANNTLPQTGHNNSKAVMALGILAGMFGLSLAAKGGKQI